MTRGLGSGAPTRLTVAAVFALFLLPAAPSARAQDVSANARSSQTSKAYDLARQSTPAVAVPEKNQEMQDENDEYLHSPTVVKIGSLFGMGPEAAATAFTVFNFMVLAAGFGYAVLKTLPRMLRNRNTAIQRKLVDARTATEEATTRLNAVEARLSRLDEQIAGMRHDAEAANTREGDRLRQTVEEEKAKILAAADAEIQAATVQARRQLQQYAAELAVENAARRLVVTADADRLLIENFSRQLGDRKGGEN